MSFKKLWAGVLWVGLRFFGIFLAFLFAVAEANENRYAVDENIKNAMPTNPLLGNLLGAIVGWTAFFGTLFGFWKRAYSEIKEGIDFVEDYNKDVFLSKHKQGHGPDDRKENNPDEAATDGNHVAEPENSDEKSRLGIGAFWPVFREQRKAYRHYAKQAEDMGLQGLAVVRYMRQRFVEAWQVDAREFQHQLIDKIAQFPGLHAWHSANPEFNLQQELWNALSGHQVNWPAVNQPAEWQGIIQEIQDFNKLHNKQLLMQMVDVSLKKDFIQYLLETEHATYKKDADNATKKDVAEVRDWRKEETRLKAKFKNALQSVGFDGVREETDNGAEDDATHDAAAMAKIMQFHQLNWPTADSNSGFSPLVFSAYYQPTAFGIEAYLSDVADPAAVIQALRSALTGTHRYSGAQSIRNYFSFGEHCHAIAYRYRLELNRYYQKSIQKEDLWAKKDQFFYKKYSSLLRIDPADEDTSDADGGTSKQAFYTKLYQLRGNLAREVDDILFGYFQSVAQVVSGHESSNGTSPIQALDAALANLKQWAQSPYTTDSKDPFEQVLQMAFMSVQGINRDYGDPLDDNNKAVLKSYLYESLVDVIGKKLRAGQSMLYTLQADVAQDEAAVYKLLQEKHAIVEDNKKAAVNAMLATAEWDALNDANKAVIRASERFQALLVAKRQARWHALCDEQRAQQLSRDNADQNQNLHPHAKLKYLEAMRENRHAAMLKLLEQMGEDYVRQYMAGLGHTVGVFVALADAFIALVNGKVVIGAFVSLLVSWGLTIAFDVDAASVFPILLGVGAVFAISALISALFLTRPAVAELSTGVYDKAKKTIRKIKEGKEINVSAWKVPFFVLAAIAATGSALFVYTYLMDVSKGVLDGLGNKIGPSFFEQIGIASDAIMPIAIAIGVLIFFEILGFRGGSLIKEVTRIGKLIKGTGLNPWVNLTPKQTAGLVASVILTFFAAFACASGSFYGIVSWLDGSMAEWAIYGIAAVVAVAGFACLAVTLFPGLTQLFVGDNTEEVPKNDDFAEAAALVEFENANAVPTLGATAVIGEGPVAVGGPGQKQVETVTGPENNAGGQGSLDDLGQLTSGYGHELFVAPTIGASTTSVCQLIPSASSAGQSEGESYDDGLANLDTLTSGVPANS